MHRKALQGLANTLCHMVDGLGRYPDDNYLASLGSGTLELDALRATARHNDTLLVKELSIVRRMHEWLHAELLRLRLQPSDLTEATVSVPYVVAPVVHQGRQLWSLQFTCTSTVCTSDAEYIGHPIPGREEFGASVQR